jgi:hypothetical protein
MPPSTCVCALCGESSRTQHDARHQSHDPPRSYFKGLEEVHNQLLGNGPEKIMLGASAPL